jgi:hypothetical protein
MQLTPWQRHMPYTFPRRSIWPALTIPSDSDKRLVLAAFAKAQEKGISLPRCYIAAARALIERHQEYRYEYAARISTQIILDLRAHLLRGLATGDPK